jgi:phage/plasmid primase-like uncharacterized protein
VRKASADTIVIADGFSCKEQVTQLTDRHALHIAQVVAMATRNPDLRERYPEQQMIEARTKEQKKSMATVAAFAGAALAGVGLLAFARAKSSNKRRFELT